MFAIAAALGVGYAAGAKPGSRHHAGKLAIALRECKKDKSKAERKKCEMTAKKKYKTRAKSHEERTPGTGSGTGTTGMPGTTTGTTATTTGSTTGTTGTTGATTGTTGTTTVTIIAPQSTPPDADCPHASLVVHVIARGGKNQEDQPIRIAGQGMCRGQVEHVLGAEGKARGSFILLPGRYEVAALNVPGGSVLASTTVTLSDDQELEVTLEIRIE
jgi:hypothetical protein